MENEIDRERKCPKNCYIVGPQGIQGPPGFTEILGANYFQEISPQTPILNNDPLSLTEIRNYGTGITYTAPTIFLNAGTYLFIWNANVASLAENPSVVIALRDITNNVNIALSGVRMPNSTANYPLSGNTVYRFTAPTELQLVNASGYSISTVSATGETSYTLSMTILRLDDNF